MDSLTSMFKQKHRDSNHFFIADEKTPLTIHCCEGKSGLIHFSDGTKCYGKCLGCKNQPCIFFSPEEIKSDCSFCVFPADADNRVCPSNAILWDEAHSCPIVDSSQCILCGICISRCPTRALYYSPMGIQCAYPSKDDPVFCRAENNQETMAFETILKFKDVADEGEIIRCVDSNLDSAYSKLLDVAKTENPQFPNLLSRNLLYCIGLKAIMRRRGDVYFRTDIVFENGGYNGLCEVEFFSTVMLDAPRDILDDMAVFIARYNFEKDRIQPLVIGLELPNQRSEYWQVIADIKKVLNIRIATLTIGAMLIIAWKQKVLNLSTQQLPYGDDEKYSIRNDVAALVGTPITCNSPRFSLFEPRK